MELNELIAIASKIPVTPEMRESARRSFAYGNVNLHNPAVTREVIDKAAERLTTTPEATE